MESVRWAFNFGAWQPARAEWVLAGRCIQPEEKTRISRFVFTRDAKAAMAGRLMLRKLLSERLKIDYSELRLDRTAKGKPFLLNKLPSSVSSLNFNLSHNGNFVVVAAEPDFQVGIDIMKVKYPSGKGVAEFFQTMSRQFTKNEWKSILSPGDEKQQLSNFYRFWCLKESYVKAIGIGIGFSLQRLSFNINSEKILKGNMYSDTVLSIDDKEVTNWMFEETMLEDEHWVATALGNETADDAKMFSSYKSKEFEELTFNDLINKALPWQPEDETFWTDFVRKEEKPR